MGAERLRALALALCLACLVSRTDAQTAGKQKGKKPRRDPGQQAPLLPGLPPGLMPGPKKPAGAPSRAQTPPPAKAPSAPPMQDADLVTAGADLRAARELERSRTLRAHFQVCDLDGNGWISLREAEVLLSCDREEYGRFDADRDGRVVLEEFAQHGEMILARLGASTGAPEELDPAEPAAAGPAPAEPPQGGKLRAMSELRSIFPRPADILARYDSDASRGLDAAELEKLCAEVGLELSSELLAAQMDPDESGQLEVGELVPLAWLTSRRLPGALRPSGATENQLPASAEDSPPQTGSRLRFRSHFARLDPSNDGAIDESDLRLLQSPARLEVRLETVLSALDRDGDRRLSEHEFGSSMSDGVPGPVAPD